MKKISVVIIDDEPIAIEVIKELIVQLTPNLVVTGTAREGLEAVEKIDALKPDLVFMDVDMPLLSGHEVLQRITYRSFFLVFTTGYVSPPAGTIHGIVSTSLSKPIDPAEFLKIVQTVQQHMEMHS